LSRLDTIQDRDGRTQQLPRSCIAARE